MEGKLKKSESKRERAIKGRVWKGNKKNDRVWKESNKLGRGRGRYSNKNVRGKKGRNKM